jgi:hypothetical protein
MSPLGTYPAKSFLGASSALVVAPDICLSIVRLKDEWKLSGFSEIDCLLPIEIPLLATLTLAVDDGEQYILPYPTHQSMYMSASHEHALDSAAVTEAADWMRSYIKARKLEEEYVDSIHRPPAAGGIAYYSIPSTDRDAHRRTILQLLEAADPVTLRGLSSLLKANMAWEHRELNEAACISLWISLDAIHSLVLQKLRNQGKSNPTSQDASNYVAGAYGVDLPDGSFFEDDYYNRIRAIHPDNRFGAEARPQFLADDFYELRHVVIELFHNLVTGMPTKLSSEPGDRGHAFHLRPL